MFERGSLSWDAGGIVLNRQHQRGSPILRFTPVEIEGRLTVDAEIPDTMAGRDALAEIRSGLFKGLSIEFRAVRQDIVAGVRRISEAVLTGRVWSIGEAMKRRLSRYVAGRNSGGFGCD